MPAVGVQHGAALDTLRREADLGGNAQDAVFATECTRSRRWKPISPNAHADSAASPRGATPVPREDGLRAPGDAAAGYHGEVRAGTQYIMPRSRDPGADGAPSAFGLQELTRRGIRIVVPPRPRRHSGRSRPIQSGA